MDALVILSSLVPMVIFLTIFLYYTLTYKKKIKEKENLLKKKMESLGFTKKTNKMIFNNNFQLFSLGSRQYFGEIFINAPNTINEPEITLFQHTYSIGSGKSTRSFTNNVLTFESKFLNLPRFNLKPERFSDKIKSILGYKDINFDNYPKFSSRHLLKGLIEEEVRDVFSSDILNFFSDKKNINVEGKEDKLIFYKKGKHNDFLKLSPEEFLLFIEEGTQIFNLFKIES